jgi:two-component system invasion response regulator UvrY
MNAEPIRIMLVDDHAVVRAGFRRLLEQEADIRVVAEADSGERAYLLYVEHAPDVLVLDLSMPGVSGFEIIRRIIERQSDAKILVFSMHEDASLAVRAIQLGARGYVTKSNAPEVLATAVVAIAAGKLFLSDDVAKAIAVLKLTGDDNPVQALGAREFEIFRLLVSGRPAAEIARILNLSTKTIANYHTVIKQKLHIGSDVELVLLALRHNLL